MNGEYMTKNGPVLIGKDEYEAVLELLKHGSPLLLWLQANDHALYKAMHDWDYANDGIGSKLPHALNALKVLGVEVPT